MKKNKISFKAYLFKMLSFVSAFAIVPTTEEKKM
jgi:hypothetical protein